MPARAARRRGNGEGTIYRGTDGRWRAAITQPDGSRQFVSARTREEVGLKLRARLAELDKGLPKLDHRITLETYALRWLADTKPLVRPKTAEVDELVLKNHLLPTLGRIPLARLGPEHVERLMTQKLAAGRAPQTVIHIRGTLRRILARAMRHGLVHRNAAALAKPPKLERHAVRVLDEAGAVALIDAAEGDRRFGQLVSLALTTGLRSGELLGLRWSDVDLERSVLHVTGELQRVRCEAPGEAPRREFQRLDYAKTATSRRTLPLSREAQESLRRQLANQREARLLAGPLWHETGLVFTSPIGTPFDQSNTRHALRRALAAAGLPLMRFHDLRHTFASLSLRAGVQLWAVSKMLGHSSIALTANTYGHLLPASERDAVDRLSGLLATARLSSLRVRPAEHSPDHH